MPRSRGNRGRQDGAYLDLGCLVAVGKAPEVSK